MIRIDEQVGERVRQGDIFQGVQYLASAFEESGVLVIKKIRFPYSIVLTQDCDLDQDARIRGEKATTQDKQLISVLLAPLYNAEHVWAGEHLDRLSIKSPPISGTAKDFLKQNQRPRHHYIEFPKETGLVPAVIDFKHYFSAPVVYLLHLSKTDFKCRVSELYREQISDRFAAFLSRIALPDE